MILKRSALVATIVAVVGMFGAAPPAGAVAPVREPLVFPEELPLSAGDFCAWEGVVTFPVVNETVTTFFDAEGNVTSVLITGSLVVTITNVENDQSVTLNISGPSVTVDDLLTYHGPSVIFPVEGSLDLVHGRVVVTVDSEGFQHPITISGSSTDICGVLA